MFSKYIHGSFLQGVSLASIFFSNSQTNGRKSVKFDTGITLMFEKHRHLNKHVFNKVVAISIKICTHSSLYVTEGF